MDNTENNVILFEVTSAGSGNEYSAALEFVHKKMFEADYHNVSYQGLIQLGLNMSNLNKIDILARKLYDSANSSRETSPAPEKTSEKDASDEAVDRQPAEVEALENAAEDAGKAAEQDDEDKQEPMEVSTNAEDAGPDKEEDSPASKPTSVTPPPEGSMSKRSSRRKPTKTRKVVEEPDTTASMDVGEGDFFEDDAEAEYTVTNGTGSGSKPGTPRPDTPTEAAAGPSGDQEESIDVDEQGNYILPEGTVLVEPEEVREDKNPIFRGPEFGAPKKTVQKAMAAGGDLSNIHCTACNKQINPNNPGAAKRHPVLKVLICRKCYNWYASDEIEQDSNGIDEQCRWCGDGGNLICCDFCHNAFCKNCIKRNLGRAELSKIMDSDDDMKWHCYVCNPRPMANLIVHCTRIISAIDEHLQKEREKRRQKEIKASSARVVKAPPVAQVQRAPQQVNVNPVRPVAPPRGMPTASAQPPQPVLLTQVPNIKTGGFQLVSVPVGQQSGRAQRQPPKVGPSVKTPPTQIMKRQLEQKRVPQPMAARSVVRQNEFWNIPITEYNVGPVLQRVNAFTHSLFVLSGSMQKELEVSDKTADFNKARTIRQSVAVKLKKALTSYRKSFNDMEAFARDTLQRIAQQQAARRNARPQQPATSVLQTRTRVPPQGHILVKKQPAAMSKPKPTGPPVVIELSDSSDEDTSSKKTPPKKIENPVVKLQNSEAKKVNGQKEDNSSPDLAPMGDRGETQAESSDRDERKSHSEATELHSLKRKKDDSSDGGDSDSSAGGQKKSFRLRVSLGSQNPGFAMKASKRQKHSKDAEDSDSSPDPETDEESSTGKQRATAGDNREVESREAEKQKGKEDEQEGDEEKTSAADVPKKSPKGDDDDDDDDKGHQGSGNGHNTGSPGDAASKDDDNGGSGDEPAGNDEDDGAGSEESTGVDKDGTRDGADELINDAESIESKGSSPMMQLDGVHDNSDIGSSPDDLRQVKHTTVTLGASHVGSNDDDDDDDNSTGSLFGHVDIDLTTAQVDFPTVADLQDLQEDYAGESEPELNGTADLIDSSDEDLGVGSTAREESQVVESEAEEETSEEAVCSNTPSRRTREDMEAQRLLHKEMMEEEAESSGADDEDVAGGDDDDDDDDDDDSSSEEKRVKKKTRRKKGSDGSGSDYNPKEDLRWEKGNRVKDRQKKIKAKFRRLKQERLEKKKRMEERKKHKHTKSAKGDNASSSDSELDAVSPEKVSKQRRGSGKRSSGSESQRNEKSWVTSRQSTSKGGDEKKKSQGLDGESEDYQGSGTSKLSSKVRLKSKAGQPKGNRSAVDSEDSDAKLEKEIEGLEKMPKLSVKSKKVNAFPETESNKTRQQAGTQEADRNKAKTEKRATQKEKRNQMIEGLTSGSENDSGDDKDDEEQEEEEDRRKRKQEDDEAADAAALELAADADEDAKARRALLMDDSDMDCNADVLSSDSDLEQMMKDKEAKSKRPSRKGGLRPTHSDAASNEEENDSDVSPRKKMLRRTKLLRANLDSDESNNETMAAKSKRKMKTTRKRKSTADDSEDFVLDESLSDSEGNSEEDFEDDDKLKKGKKVEETASDHQSEATETEDDKKKGKKGKKGRKRKRIKVASDSSEADTDTDSEAGSRKKRKKKKGSDEESDEEDDAATPGKKRKHIRKIIKDKKISKETKDAAKAEEERRKRVKEKQKLYNDVTVEDTNSPTKCPITTKLILEVDEDRKPIIEVPKDLVRKLKPHQVEAVRFLWDCCIEDLGRLKEEPGAGCILAHCMGLGKTLSVIAFVHTLMCKKNRKKTRIRTCMVVCPLNTVLNWQAEFEKWLDEDELMDVYELSSVKDNQSRADVLQLWQEGGGILIMGYDMYRNLSRGGHIRKKKLKEIMAKTLVDPGPDLVVCDEGHILKNDASGLSKAMNQIKTRRRIVLTGTPLQNNLVEYHCMVDFVKPKLLGTRREFLNRFVNPITNGQCIDSSAHDVRVMKRRAHILHETLAGCVQRKDYSALTKFLMPKQEYVLAIRLCKMQIELYEKYLERAKDSAQTYGKGGKLFSDYQNLMRIWTHPWVLKLDEIRQENKRAYDSESEDSFLDDGTSESEAMSSNSDSDSIKVLSDSEAYAPRRTRASRAAQKQSEEPQPGPSNVRPRRRRKIGTDSDNDTDSDFDEVVKGWKTSTRNGGDGAASCSKNMRGLRSEEVEDEPVSRQWWAEWVTEEDKYRMQLSGKLVILAEVLKMCDAIGDKVLVFSQSLLSLDLIEDFLEYWDGQSRSADAKDHEDDESMLGLRKSWIPGADYYRMDGSTNAQTRRRQAESFNDEENDRARLFLISTKAGGLGINLVAANRVIIFDASWNPSHDIQSIFRVYRFGQIKPVYVYRLLAQGTMEEKIYERQVTKESLSSRVIDEHQIERHFSAADLAELYNFQPDRLDDPNREEQPTPELPEDRMLAELLTSQKDWIVQYHKHDSLLENQIDQELTEEERKAAWEEYEQEKKGPSLGAGPRLNPMYANQAAQLNAWNAQLMAHANAYQNHPMYVQQQNTLGDVERITRAIYNANPGISEDDLRARVQHYLKVQQQQQARRLQDQERYRLLVRQQQEQQYQLMYQQAQQAAGGSGLNLLSGMLQSAAGAQRHAASSEATVQQLLRYAQSGRSSSESAGQKLLRTEK